MTAVFLRLYFLFFGWLVGWFLHLEPIWHHFLLIHHG